MTTFQTTLIARLAERNIEASFRGRYLNCLVKITNASTGKIKRQRFSFIFDTAEDCQGSRLLGDSLKGAYSDAHAHRAAEIIRSYSDEVAQVEMA